MCLHARTHTHTPVFFADVFLADTHTSTDNTHTGNTLVTAYTLAQEHTQMHNTTATERERILRKLIFHFHL